ncbi:MAG TPA: hypothetical protein PLD20_21705 [Blastocatellia bacterium]|nr:hypothetical protein [Blastocatellia bacterium]HMZ20568.1 hypothetical protein [Blastocatellia bacterium]
MFRKPPFHSDNHVVFATLTILALLLIAISISRTIYPFDVGHFEACVWMPSLLSAQGENPYAYATREPFVMAPYGYLYYLTVGVGLRLFGWQLWFGRLLTVAAAAVCLWCLVRLSREVTGRQSSAAVAGMAFLTSLPLYHYLAVHRPDLPSLALGISAVALAFADCAKPLPTGRGTDSAALPDRGTDGKHWRTTLLVAGLLVAAVYFKQTTVLPIAVVIARYWQAGRWRQAALILSAVAGMGLALAVALHLTSAGGYFWQHFVLMRQVPHSYQVSLKWLGSMFRSPSTWIALGILAAGTGRQVREWKLSAGAVSGKVLVAALKSPELLLSSYFVAAALVAFVTSARSGSYVNYYLETSMALAVMAAMGWNWLAGSQERRQMLLGIAGLFLLAGGVEFWRMARAESYRWKSLGYYREVVETLKREVPPDRLVVSVHPELAIASGHKYYFGDFLQYIDGRSPELQKLIADEFASGRYGAVVWLTPNDPKLAGYRQIPMKLSVHEKHYPVYLYLTKPD